MTKIPVGKTIAHAYRFTFQNFVPIICVMWPAWVLMAVIMFFMRGDFVALTQASATRNFTLLQGHLGRLLLSYLVIFVLLFMQITGLTRLSLGLPMPSRHYYFSLGKPVWRLIGAVLLTVLAIAAVVAVYALAIFVLGLVAAVFLHGQTAGAAKAIVALLTVLALLIAYCGMIFMVARFFFLLAPVVVAEESINIGRAWLLTNRNFWRIFLIVLSLAGPMPLLPQGNSPDQLLAFQQAQRAWQLSYMSRMFDYWYLVFPAGALLSVLIYGVSCAAQAFAYRQLTLGEALTPVALH